VLRDALREPHPEGHRDGGSENTLRFERSFLHVRFVMKRERCAKICL
jgi:hypothetical protein